MASKKKETEDKIKKVTEEQEKAEYDAFIQEKSRLLKMFLIEHSVGLQPILQYSQYGIQPSVVLVKDNSAAKNEEQK